MGPLSTIAETPSWGLRVTLAQVGVEFDGMTVYVAWQPPVLPNESNW